MNYNIIASIIYLLIILYIVLYVGATLYRNGIPFLLKIFNGDPVLSASVNKFLLAGYYLINFGYSAMVIKGWKPVISFQQALELVSSKAGMIILLLGLMHFFNLFTLICISKRNSRKINNQYSS